MKLWGSLLLQQMPSRKTVSPMVILIRDRDSMEEGRGAKGILRG